MGPEAPLKAPGEASQAPPRRRHRGIQWVGVGVSILFLGALILALLSTRRIQGSIPGSDSMLSLAAIRQGFLVGTAGGLLESPDGRTWLAATNIPREPVSVASDGTTSYVLAGGILKSTKDLRIFGTVATGVTLLALFLPTGGTGNVGWSSASYKSISTGGSCSTTFWIILPVALSALCSFFLSLR